MGIVRIAGVTGVVAGLAAVPILHFVAVDLEGKDAAQSYLARVDDHYLRIALAGGLGMVLAVVVLTHLLAVRRLAAGRRPLLADVSTGVASVAALGVALSSAAAMMAGYGAHENFPFEAIRPMGLLAENLVAVLAPALAGTALLVAVLALRDRVLPRWLGYVGALFAIVLAVLGVVLPGAGLPLAILWLLVAGAGLLLVREPVQA